MITVSNQQNGHALARVSVLRPVSSHELAHILQRFVAHFYDVEFVFAIESNQVHGVSGDLKARKSGGLARVCSAAGFASPQEMSDQEH